MVEGTEDLIGKKDMYFMVYIKNATELPEGSCANPFVTY
jgi:hypothetical protein